MTISAQRPASELRDLSDTELLQAFRETGDADFYGELFRRHLDAATRLARAVAPDHTAADDIVAEAFTGTMHAIQAGAGPTEHFRAYLLTSVRNGASRLCADHATLTELDEASVPESDSATPEYGDQTERAARAFQSLSARHQSVLWHMEVEGRKPRDVAPLLGIEPNAVSALLLRATKSLRMAYLADYFTAPPAPRCAKLSGAMRKVALGVATRSQRAQVSAHVATCERCDQALADLMNVTRTMRSAVFVVLVGGIGTSTIGGILLGGAAPASAAGLGGGATATAHGAAHTGALHGGLLHSIGTKATTLFPRTPGVIGIAAASAVVVTAVVGAAVASATPWRDPTAHAEAPAQPAAASSQGTPAAGSSPVASPSSTAAPSTPAVSPATGSPTPSVSPAALPTVAPGLPAATSSPATPATTGAPTTKPTATPTTAPTASPTGTPTPDPTSTPTPTETAVPSAPTAPSIRWSGDDTSVAAPAVVITRTDGLNEPSTVHATITSTPYFARWIRKANAEHCAVVAGTEASTLECTFREAPGSAVRINMPGTNRSQIDLRVTAYVETAAGRSDSAEMTFGPGSSS